MSLSPPLNPPVSELPRTLAADLPAAPPGEPVRLQGWVHRRRELARVTFLVVRDRTGLAQVVLPPDAWRVMFWLATIPAALLAFGEHAVERLTTVNGCLTEPMMLTLSIHHIKLCCCFHLSKSASLLPGCSCRFAVCAGEPAVAVCQ